VSRIEASELAMLREALAYDPVTGIFKWVKPLAPQVKVGSIAGDALSKIRRGGAIIRFNGRRYYAHRLAWEFSIGPIGNYQIDHINGNEVDNRIANLRLATSSVNGQNKRGAQSNNKLGLLGVHERRGMFLAQIKLNGKHRYLGSFQTKEAAYAAYLEAKRTLHPGCTI
jgi:hypothetical protein